MNIYGLEIELAVIRYKSPPPNDMLLILLLQQKKN